MNRIFSKSVQMGTGLVSLLGTAQNSKNFLVIHSPFPDLEIKVQIHFMANATLSLILLTAIGLRKYPHWQ